MDKLIFIFLEPRRALEGLKRSSGPLRPLLILWLTSLFVITSLSHFVLREAFIQASGMTMALMAFLIVLTGVIHMFMSLSYEGDPILLLYRFMFAGFPFIALPLIGDIIGKIGDGAENIFILLLFFLVFRSLLAAVAETYKTGYFVAITAFSVCFFGFIFLFSGAVQLL